MFYDDFIERVRFTFLDLDHQGAGLAQSVFTEAVAQGIAPTPLLCVDRLEELRSLVLLRLIAPRHTEVRKLADADWKRRGPTDANVAAVAEQLHAAESPRFDVLLSWRPDPNQPDSQREDLVIELLMAGHRERVLTFLGRSVAGDPWHPKVLEVFRMCLPDTVKSFWNSAALPADFNFLLYKRLVDVVLEHPRQVDTWPPKDATEPWVASLDDDEKLFLASCYKGLGWEQRTALFLCLYAKLNLRDLGRILAGRPGWPIHNPRELAALPQAGVRLRDWWCYALRLMRHEVRHTGDGHHRNGT